MPTTEAVRLRDVLEKVLPLIAGSTGGVATITDAAGRWLTSVGPDLRPLPGEPAFVAGLCRRAAAAGTPLTLATSEEPPVEIWAVPLGPYVLAASNRYRAVHEHELYQALVQALPLIAQVAGGEAVVFNREGRRVASALPDGSGHPDVGKVHPPFTETMARQRPLISPSRTIPGVTSVRIPLNTQFGLGFNNALTIRRGQRLIEEVKKHRHARYDWRDITGNSAENRRAITLAQRAGESAAPVLLSGETGTGKELFAQAIHNGSSRREQPFVSLNCAALPASLIESQLFGYVDGAFTGARKGGQAGYFEEADGGTLLLDEISEMDLTLQAKLLRVLQEKEVTRIGGCRTIRVDVRIIATTNRNLTEMIAAGAFRVDLYYRLNVIHLPLPPLRERQEDIPLLAEQFLRRYSRLTGKVITEIHPAAMAALSRYHWPGNIRQLQNCIEAAFSLADGRVLLPQHLPPELLSPAGGTAQPAPTLAAAVERTERDAITAALRACGGVRHKAAAHLDISVSTLWRKMKELGLEPDAPTDARG